MLFVMVLPRCNVLLCVLCPRFTFVCVCGVVGDDHMLMYVVV